MNACIAKAAASRGCMAAHWQECAGNWRAKLDAALREEGA